MKPFCDRLFNMQPLRRICICFGRSTHTLTCRKLSFGPRHIFRCQGSEEWPGFVRSISWETEHTAAALWCVRRWGGRDIEPSLQLTCIHYSVRTGWHGVQLWGDGTGHFRSANEILNWPSPFRPEQASLCSLWPHYGWVEWWKIWASNRKIVSLNSTPRESFAHLVKAGFSNFLMLRTHQYDNPNVKYPLCKI